MVLGFPDCRLQATLKTPILILFKMWKNSSSQYFSYQNNFESIMLTSRFLKTHFRQSPFGFSFLDIYKCPKPIKIWQISCNKCRLYIYYRFLNLKRKVKEKSVKQWPTFSRNHGLEIKQFLNILWAYMVTK